MYCTHLWFFFAFTNPPLQGWVKGMALNLLDLVTVRQGVRGLQMSRSAHQIQQVKRALQQRS